MIRFVLFVTLASALSLTQEVCAQGRSSLVEVGPQLTQIYLPVNPVGSVQYQPGIGGVFSARLYKTLGLDFGISTTPTIPISSTSFAGGRLTEGFFGTRAGLVIGRLGVYAKARPGFVSFGEAILHTGPTPGSGFQFGRLTEPAFDIGGIALVRVSTHFSVRYEMSDTIISYGSRTIQPSFPPVPSRVVNCLQFGTGLVARF